MGAPTHITVCCNLSKFLINRKSLQQRMYLTKMTNATFSIRKQHFPAIYGINIIWSRYAIPDIETVSFDLVEAMTNGSPLQSLVFAGYLRPCKKPNNP